MQNQVREGQEPNNQAPGPGNQPPSSRDYGVDPGEQPVQDDQTSPTYNRKFSRCVMDGIRSGESYLDAKKKCDG